MSSEPPLIRIDLASAAPAYEQIAGALRGLLVARELAPGDNLPPVRQVAVDLGVHFNTVAQAYRLLAEEGWLDLRQGRGATVRARSTTAASADSRKAVSLELNHLVASALARGVTPKEIRAETDRLLKKYSAQPS